MASVIIKYGVTFPAEKFSDPLQMEFYCIRKGGQWKGKKGQTLGLGLFEHYRNAGRILFPEDDEHRWSNLALQNIIDHKYIGLLGPRDCVSGDTKILNPITGEEPTIESLYLSKTCPTVQTLIGPEKAGVPFVKGERDLFEVICDDQTKFTASGQHFVLTPAGYISVSCLQIGQRLAAYDQDPAQSILEPCQSIPFSGDRSSVREKVIQSIKSVGRGKVYDLTVPNAHHYFSQGFIHHNSNKTYAASKYTIIRYWADPINTLALLSSTEGRGLELRIWGKVKELFNRGQERQDREGFDPLPGNVLENMHTITTDIIDERDKKKRGRVLNRGIICIPCAAGLQAGAYSGISKYIGIKQDQVLLVADELPFMGPAFIEAIANLGQGPKNKIIGLGNAYDPLDCMGRFCEPEQGYDAYDKSLKDEPVKTRVYKTKWPDGVCVNFVGTDSPNFDHPANEPVKYGYLVNRVGMADIEAFWGPDSPQFFSQCVGIYKPGLLSKRFWSTDFCAQHHAHDMAFWDNTERTKLCSLDAAYGGQGGDRCVFREGEFGLSHDGRDILRVGKPELVPVSVRNKADPEDQIAMWIFDRMTTLGIPFNMLFFDSTGRGSLGSAFAKLMKGVVPTPVEFGGKPSTRPVRHDLFVTDEVTQARRLKRCDEQYLDMVSELWFSCRHMVHAEQMRELDLETAREGCQREIGVWSKSRDFVESKHNPQHRKKMARSPDLMDNLVTMVEGARRLGFEIENLGGKVLVEQRDDSIREMHDEYRGILKKHLLNHR